MAEEQILRWQIGEVRITRILEFTAEMPFAMMFPTVEERELHEMDWLKPHFVNPEGGISLSIHALLVEAPGKTVVVDTCFGNDKSRAQAGDMLSTRFLEKFESEGVDRHKVDAVFCTHLHVDHVGWNTMLVDGGWVPTFPNARYLLARTEYDYWRDNPQSDDDRALFADSVQPVVDAGLVDFVDMNHQICDELHLVPSPGHTPGHACLWIRSLGQEAMITGDMTHHPCQWTRTDWAVPFDVNQAQSMVTRHEMAARLADRPVLVIGTHYPAPTAGHIVSRNGQTRFVT